MRRCRRAGSDDLPSHISSQEWSRLREDYALALLNHAGGGSVIAARLAAVAIPTDEEFELEESAALGQHRPS
jgi:hypothetical protein